MLRNPGVKRVLGELPLAAEVDWALRSKGAPVGGFKLEKLKTSLPEWSRQAAASPLRAERGRKVLLFSTLHYWIEQAALCALALAGMGHQVTFAYLPYSNWQKPVDKFDLRRRELYAREVFEPAQEVLADSRLSLAGRTAQEFEALLTLAEMTHCLAQATARRH